VVGVPHIDHSREDRLRQQIDKVIAGIEPPVFPNAYGIRFVPVRQPDSDTDIRMSYRVIVWIGIFSAAVLPLLPPPISQLSNLFIGTLTICDYVCVMHFATLGKVFCILCQTVK